MSKNCGNCLDRLLFIFGDNGLRAHDNCKNDQLTQHCCGCETVAQFNACTYCEDGLSNKLCNSCGNDD